MRTSHHQAETTSNGDGWPDILVLGRVHLHQAFWYESPKGAAGLWREHFVFERVKGESPPFLDADGDGKPELFRKLLPGAAIVLCDR